MEVNQHSCKSAVDIWLDAWKDHAADLVHPLDSVYLQQKVEQLRSRHTGQTVFYAPEAPPPVNLDIKTTQFRRELGAVPFVGNIRTATIFLLMINPGVNPGDYSDRANPKTQSPFTRNKRQELQTCFALEPNQAQGWSPYYLRKTFGGVLNLYGDRYDQARTFLSQNVAILELVPYFSQNVTLLDQLNMGEELPTAILAKNAAQELADDPNNLIITRWKNTEQRWGLEGRTLRSICRNGLAAHVQEALRHRMGNAGIRPDNIR